MYFWEVKAGVGLLSLGSRHRPEYILSRGKEDASTTSIPHHFMHNSTTNDWLSR